MDLTLQYTQYGCHLQVHYIHNYSYSESVLHHVINRFFFNLAPTSPPLNLSLDELGSTYALLRWSPPPQNECNGAIQNYQISLNSSVGSNLNLTTAGSQLYILLDFLVPNTGYTCTVAAVTVSPGPTSAPLQFTTNISGKKSGEFCSVPVSKQSNSWFMALLLSNSS